MDLVVDQILMDTLVIVILAIVTVIVIHIKEEEDMVWVWEDKEMKILLSQLLIIT